ncbi:MAG TPA: hypothetical protein VE776_01130, partial [Actinomycetota bacterium]|nr:hypothetical protein [Actinomycetota bacterium]
YGPRTAHGSSLSPAVHAALLARAGHPNQALAMLEMACRLDLDDLTGTVDEPVTVALPGLRPRRVTPPGTRYLRAGTTWQERP